MTLPYKAPNWKTAPISPVCERMVGAGLKDFRFCGKPSSWAYPAAGGGWQSLCSDCAAHHHPHIFGIEALIESGERFEAGCRGSDLIVMCDGCTHFLSEEEVLAGYTNAINGKPLCEVCWQHGLDDKV